MSNIKKIWGELNNVFLHRQVKIDILTLEKNTGCSIHFHEHKINRFCLIRGKVKIKTDLGEKLLKKNEVFDVYPKTTHQFIALQNSILIEIAFVDTGVLEEKDIIRKVQGGKFIKGKFYTLNKLKKENWNAIKNIK